MTGRTVLVAVLLAGVAGTAVAAPAWRERSLAARRAYLDHEYAACAETLRVLREILPGHPGLTYLLAQCEGQLGRREGALAALDAYAATGLTQDVGRDSAFAGLWTDPSFVRIAEQLKANAAPRSQGKVIHRFSDPDLLVEDVAWDPGTRRWLASSIHGRKIVAIDPRGRESDFITAGRDSVFGLFALGVDAKCRRLWATTAATHEMPGGMGVKRACAGGTRAKSMIAGPSRRAYAPAGA